MRTVNVLTSSEEIRQSLDDQAKDTFGGQQIKDYQTTKLMRFFVKKSALSRSQYFGFYYHISIPKEQVKEAIQDFAKNVFPAGYKLEIITQELIVENEAR